MKRIAFLIPTLTGGGAERVIVNLVKHLDRRRFRITLAVVTMHNAVLHDEIPKDVEFIDLAANRVRFALPKIVALMWRLKPDVMFSTLGHLNVALAIVRWLLPRKIRTVARETTVVSCSLRHSRFPIFWSALYRHFYRKHDEVIFQSRYMHDDLIANFQFPLERARIIHNPVDVDRVRALALEAVSLAAPGAINLVAAGRLDNEKGFDLLIDAIALLSNKFVHVTVMGEGPLEAILKERAILRGVNHRVSFVGFKANPYPWFARADAYVLSSRYDGFPNVLLEALACGTPVIATPAPGGTQEILNGIEGCLIADEVSATGLAKSIDVWLTGPRMRVAANVVDRFRLERIIGKYECALLQERRT